MKTIYIIYNDDPWEYQIVFDEQLHVLDGWSMNDANWRDEYMNGFMEKLGIKVLNKLPLGVKNTKTLMRKAAKELFGL